MMQKSELTRDQLRLSQERKIISARQMQKLVKDENSVFLAIVRATNESPQK